MNSFAEQITGTVNILTVVIWVVVIFVAALLIFLILRNNLRVGRRQKKWDAMKDNPSFTQTVGFIRGIQRTGLTINDQPQLLIQLDVLDENGTVFQASCKEIIPLEMLFLLTSSMLLPVRYKSSNKESISIDPNPSEEKIYDVIDRYFCLKHPHSSTLEERRALRQYGVKTKALITDLRLTGKEENGDMEAEVTIRITDNQKGDIIAKRTMYLTNRMLESIIVGKYVDVRILPNSANQFSFILKANLYF